ncbi:hypothetical protein ACROYT_G007051 [Oculina patagonica]
MATQWTYALVTCFLLFIVMEVHNPVLAKKGHGRFKKLANRVSKLEEVMEQMNKCNACSLAASLEEIKEEIAELKEPPASSVPPTSTSPPSPSQAAEVGDRVLGRWTNNKYYPGVVEERPSGELIKIKFDDGDEITHNVDDVSAVLHDKALTEVHSGQHVMATWKGGAKYYIGFVTETSDSLNPGNRVRFDDNDEDDYSAEDLRDFPDAASAWQVGARVFARWSNGLYYRAFVVKATDSGVSILYDDGDTIDHNKSDAAAVILDKLPLSNELQVGQRVIGFWPGRVRYYPATISSINAGKYHVKFDDGDERDEHLYEIRILPA